MWYIFSKVFVLKSGKHTNGAVLRLLSEIHIKLIFAFKQTCLILSAHTKLNSNSIQQISEWANIEHRHTLTRRYTSCILCPHYSELKITDKFHEWANEWTNVNMRNRFVSMFAYWLSSSIQQKQVSCFCIRNIKMKHMHRHTPKKIRLIRRHSHTFTDVDFVTKID